jgi:D-amino peptidase
MTRVYVSADMEGIAGIATLDQVARGGFGYARAQRLMTEEANAVISGAFDGGATEVLINDSHGTMDNLLPEELDPRARLVIGSPKMQCMAEGISSDYDVAIFLGYHAPAGGSGVLAHTFSSHFTSVRVNGSEVSEAGVNSLQLAAIGVPLGLVTGDDVICKQIEASFPGVRTVTVKNAHGWSAADSLSPHAARALIRLEAAAAVREIPPAQGMPELLVLEVDLPNPTAAEMAAGVPGMIRIGDRTVRRDVRDPNELIGLITVLYTLAASAVHARQAIVTRR